jgi:hypothetical protein
MSAFGRGGPMPNDTPFGSLEDNKTLPARFWKKVKKTDSCWLWTAVLAGFGYGRIYSKGSMRLAHRVSWELHNGAIPPGMCVLHHCDNPACVNPEHLFLGTYKDNDDDAIAKGRVIPSERAWHAAAFERNKTHCAQGHPYDERNTYLRPRGGRDCRECARLRMQRLQRRRRGG